MADLHSIFKNERKELYIVLLTLLSFFQSLFIFM